MGNVKLLLSLFSVIFITMNSFAVEWGNLSNRKSITLNGNSNAGPEGERKWFSVRSTDSNYNSPIIGNGEVVTTIGPTGYHNGFCPAEEVVNRTIFWAGRRLRDARSAKIRIPRVPPEELIGPTIPLIRLGRLTRTLTINGIKTKDEDWEQTLDYDLGLVLSTLNHGAIREQTQSLVCLTSNLLIFHTQLENRGNNRSQIEFVLDYEFGDAEGERALGTRLHIRRPHPDDLAFGNVEGMRSLETDLENRPPHLLESLSVQYEVEDHLGEVHIGRYPLGIIRETETGGRFIHQIELDAGEATNLWFWVILSDRLKYTHFPDFERVTEFVDAHKGAWEKFWNNSRVEFGNPDLEALRKSCLYTLRCNASPWSIPPGYLSTHWEGRTFHDEFYPFMALISGNYLNLAERIPNYRLLTLPVAIRRSGGRGAFYAWEATEYGEESAPYGHWTDERFIHGQFSEAAWRYYLHTRDLDDLARYYPVMRGCAEWLIHDVLVRDQMGRLKTRIISDISEATISAQNSIFVACATIRTLENAVRAAELLEIDLSKQDKWRVLAAELRQTLPVDEIGQVYRYADDTDNPPGTAHLGMVFPFSFEVHGDRARNTLARAYKNFQSQGGIADSDTVLSYNWIWAIGHMATACFYQGLADQGYEVLNQAPAVVGPFMASNEHYRNDKGAFLPWFTTGAGAFVYALHAMFVQVIDELGAIILPALPSKIQDAHFEGLLASHNVTVSGRVRKGKVISLYTQSERPMKWSFRIPRRLASTAKFVSDVKVSQPDAIGLVTVECLLTEGITWLVR